MIHRYAFCLAPLLALGCASAPPPAATTTAAPVAAPATAADAAVAAVDEPAAEPRFSGASVLFEEPWPQPDAPSLRFAVVTTAPGPDPGVTTVAWETAPGQDEVDLTAPLPPTALVQRVSMLDATGDGAADAVVWIDPTALPPEQPAHSAVVFTLGGPRHQPRRATWTSLALGAVADDAALRAAAATVRSFALPEGAPSLDAVVLRLGFATAAQFRSLVAPGGLVVCDSAAGNAHPHYRRCRTLAAAALTDAFYAEHLRGTVALFQSPADPDDAPLVDSYERCRTLGARVVCGIPTGGPATTALTFTGPAAARRLARVETTVFEDS
ncbi:MAG: hypothetical protein JWM10_3751 [Myxococcaceae bacterium]|nr:hypothetical protein [Myxococcaceae bacterium]